MSSYIATFHTHLAAMMTHRALTQRGCRAAMGPVPRKLSSSCGTCVRYEAPEPCLDAMDADVESVYEVAGKEDYSLLHHNQ